MDFFNKLVEAIKRDEKQPGYIQGEIARFKHEKEIAQKTAEHKIKIISNILGEIDKVLKLNPTKSGLVFPQIREADYLDINGKPYGDWNGYRKRRREAGTFFPMANYDFLDPAGFNILHDDCEDMIDLLQSRGKDCTIDLMMDLLFARCDLIATRFNYLRGCVSINVNTAPDYLVADFSTAFASKRGKKGGSKPKQLQGIEAAVTRVLKSGKQDYSAERLWRYFEDKHKGRKNSLKISCFKVYFSDSEKGEFKEHLFQTSPDKRPQSIGRSAFAGYVKSAKEKLK